MFNTSLVPTVLLTSTKTYLYNVTDDDHEDDDHHEHEHEDHDQISSAFISVVSIIISLFICFGNSSTLIAIMRNHRLKNIPNMYIASLAVADLMVGLMLLIRSVTELQSTKVVVVEHEEQLCLTFMSMMFVSVAASMLSYLLVACDRYIYIMHSLKYVRLVTKQRSLVIIFLAWIFAAVYGTVPAYTSHFSRSEGCTPTHVFAFVYMIIVHPVFFLLLGASTFCLYFQIAKTALNQQRRIRDQEVCVGGTTGQRGVSQRTWKAVKILMLVSGFFFTCWFPLLIVAFLEYTIHVEHLALSVTCLVALMNSGVNFVVLVAMKREFRAEFQSLMCSCGIWCCRAKIRPLGVSTIVTSWADSYPDLQTV